MYSITYLFTVLGHAEQKHLAARKALASLLCDALPDAAERSRLMGVIARWDGVIDALAAEVHEMGFDLGGTSSLLRQSVAIAPACDARAWLRYHGRDLLDRHAIREELAEDARIARRAVRRAKRLVAACA